MSCEPFPLGATLQCGKTLPTTTLTMQVLDTLMRCSSNGLLGITVLPWWERLHPLHPLYRYSMISLLLRVNRLLRKPLIWSRDTDINLSVWASVYRIQPELIGIDGFN